MSFWQRTIVIPVLALVILALVFPSASPVSAATSDNFSTHTLPFTADGAASVYAADVDGDGDIDLMSALYGDDRIAWYENTAGDGSAWTSDNVTTTADGPWSVYAADVDGDGDTDLMSASEFDDKIAWYENTARDGSSWTSDNVTISADGPWSVYAADVDGDGDIDLMSASHWDHKIRWYENTAGDGSAWTAYDVTGLAGATAIGAYSVYAADVDGDGDIDLMSASSGDDKIAWYENTASDGSAWTEHVVTISADGARSVYAADVDGDGDIDLMSALYADNKIAWYENKLRDALPWEEHTLPFTADGAQSVYAADVDGDGDIDLMSASCFDGKIAWYENTAGDGSDWTEHVITTSAWGGAWSVYAADVDGDGDIDLMSASLWDDKICWYENLTIHRSACFPQPSEVTTSAIGAWSVHAADVDGDGDIDLMSASYWDDKIRWYENPSWTEHDVTELAGTTADATYSVYAADVDGDGDTDLMSASEFDDKIAWYENTASDGSAWTEHVVTISADGAASVYAADVDGDGDTDLMSASEFDDKIAWYENPSWTAYDVTGLAGTTADYAMSVYAADVDGDGDIDLMSASEGDNKIAWYENAVGDGTLWTAYDVTSLAGTIALGPWSVCAADVDGDGDIDLMSASGGDNKIAWYENTAGDGSDWTEHVITTSADSAYSVYAADVDGDGDIDLMSASEFDDKIAWYENTAGDGSAWTEHVITTSADSARSVYAADVDGDGDIDLMSASYWDNKIAWYPNCGGQFALATSDTAPAALYQGQTDDMLKITATHRGCLGDVDMELATLDLLFEESAGDPLTTAEANALIENLFIYLDDGSGTFETDTDTLVATVDTLALAAGKQAVTFTDGDTNVQVCCGTPRTYFVAAELTANAGSQTPDRFCITHLTQSSSTAEDRDYDLPLSLEYAANVLSGVMTATIPPPPSWGGTPAAPGYYLKMDVLGKKLSILCSSSGEAQQTGTVTSPDGRLTITILRGTIARDKSGNALGSFEVTVNESPPPPGGANIIGLAYNFGPPGATFAPPITLTFSYDPADIPEGVAEEDLVLAYYNEDAGQWVTLDCVVDTVNHTITAQVSHFTTFAIIGGISPLASAAFSVSNLSVQPAQVQPGEAVTIAVSVANHDGVEGSYNLALSVNGVEQDTKDVTIAAGGSEAVTFSVAKEEVGSYTVAIDGLSGSFDVVAPAAPPISWTLIWIIIAALVIGVLVFFLATRRAY
jgi:hypothetical protein